MSENIKTDYYWKGEIVIQDMDAYNNIGNEDGIICNEQKDPIVFNNESDAREYLKDNIPFAKRHDRFLFVPVNHTVEYSEN